MLQLTRKSRIIRSKPDRHQSGLRSVLADSGQPLLGDGDGPLGRITSQTSVLHVEGANIQVGESLTSSALDEGALLQSVNVECSRHQSRDSLE